MKITIGYLVAAKVSWARGGQRRISSKVPLATFGGTIPLKTKLCISFLGNFGAIFLMFIFLIFLWPVYRKWWRQKLVEVFFVVLWKYLRKSKLENIFFLSCTSRNFYKNVLYIVRQIVTCRVHNVYYRYDLPLVQMEINVGIAF